MKGKHPARTIHAWRSSGTNVPGYSRPPTQQAPQPPADPWDDDGTTVSLGRSKAAERVRARVDAARGVSLGDPVRVPAEAAVVPVYLDGHRVRVPVDWAISISSRQGRDVLHLREPRGDALHVLLIDSNGVLRELHGLPDDLVRDLVALHFPRGTR